MSIESTLERIATALERIASLAPAAPAPPEQIRMPPPEPPKAPEPAKVAEPTITLHILKERFSVLSGKGHREKLLNLLKELGTDTLPKLPPEKFQQAMAALQKMEAS
ncbi:hypothetical protein CCP4SC76_4600005 [Gammaproteobacteria bacterium]